MAKHAIVALIRIADGREMARWDPDWSAVFKNVVTVLESEPRTRSNEKGVLAMHPLLLTDGSIIFKTTNSVMARLNACERKPAWALGHELMHHSTEMGADGNIWTPGVTNNAFPQNAWLTTHLRDDALVRLSIDGKVLEKRSFSKILLKSGLETMLFGHSGLAFNDDPIHLNQISIAATDSHHWKKDDLLISARHLSTVFLYRPSEDKIIWYQQGPWINQHSARFVDDHRISVFDNHVVGGAPSDQPFAAKPYRNRVIVYDFATKEISEPFKSLLDQAKPRTITEGRAQLLPDGGLFIEETNTGRHLRFTADKLLWSRINYYNDKYIGLVSWSRYLTADEVQAPLRAIASNPKCIALAQSQHDKAEPMA